MYNVWLLEAEEITAVAYDDNTNGMVLYKFH